MALYFEYQNTQIITFFFTKKLENDYNYGLNEKIGNISFYDSSGQSEYSFGKPYSESTAKTIDEEVKKLTDIAYVKTKQILNSNKDKLTILAEKLLEREVIFKEDLEEIFGKRPFDKQEIPVENKNTLLA